jgi:hypothetical protein
LAGLDDLAVSVVSDNSERWIEPCLRSIAARAGSLSTDVPVVDAESHVRTPEIVGGFPGARLLRCRNGDGRLDPTIRYYPNALRALGDALSAERLPGRPRWLGELELEGKLYDREVDCDWTVGSFMLVRREAIESAGFMDERFFMYSEETDFCRRIKSAGWEVRHLPWMTILHYGATAGVDARIESLSAYNRVAYARKHFSPGHRALYFATMLLRHGARAIVAGRGELGRCRQKGQPSRAQDALGPLAGASQATGSCFRVAARARR